jgi:hypothetical protein
MDVQVETSLLADELIERLREVAPSGIEFCGARELGPSDLKLSRLIRSYDLALAPPADGAGADSAPGAEVELLRRVREFSAAKKVMVARGDREIDVRGLVESVDLFDIESARALARVLSWSGTPPLVRARVAVLPDGSAKPIEVAAAIFGREPERQGAPRLCRLGFPGLEREGLSPVVDAPASFP